MFLKDITRNRGRPFTLLEAVMREVLIKKLERLLLKPQVPYRREKLIDVTLECVLGEIDIVSVQTFTKLSVVYRSTKSKFMST